MTAPNLAFLDPRTKVDVQRMEIFRKLETLWLSFFGFALQTCKELVTVVIVL